MRSFRPWLSKLSLHLILQDMKEALSQSHLLISRTILPFLQSRLIPAIALFDFTVVSLVKSMEERVCGGITVKKKRIVSNSPSIQLGDNVIGMDDGKSNSVAWRLGEI